MSTTVITTAGIAAANNAGIYGPQISITSFKIGDAIINPVSSMTSVVTTAAMPTPYIGVTSQITYQVIDDSNVLFKITLDDSVGTFNIGNIGLYLSDGTLFAITALPGVTQKIATNYPATIGNRRIFNIIIQMSGVANATNLTVLIQDEAALPVVQSELVLPPPAVAPFPVYMINNHSVYGRPAFGLRYNDSWYFVPADTDDGYGTYISSAYFDSNVLVGQPVAWSAPNKKFVAGDGTNYSIGAVGIRGPGDKILTFGDVYIIPANTPVFVHSFVPGQTYYAGSAGSLVTTPNDFEIGVALNTNALLMTIGRNQVGQQYIDAKDNLRVLKSGDIMSGELIIAAGSSTSNTDFLALTPTDAGFGIPSLKFHKEAQLATWGISVTDGATPGNLNITAAAVNVSSTALTLTSSNAATINASSLTVNSPVSLTAKATAPTVVVSDSSSNIATTAFVHSQIGTGQSQVPTNLIMDTLVASITLNPLTLRSNRFTKYVSGDTILIDDDRGSLIIAIASGITIKLPVTQPSIVDHAIDGWEVNFYNRSGGVVYITTQTIHDTIVEFPNLPFILPDKSSVTINRGDISVRAYELYNYNGVVVASMPTMTAFTEAEQEFNDFFLLEYPNNPAF